MSFLELRWLVIYVFVKKMAVRIRNWKLTVKQMSVILDGVYNLTIVGINLLIEMSELIFEYFNIF